MTRFFFNLKSVSFYASIFFHFLSSCVQIRTEHRTEQNASLVPEFDSVREKRRVTIKGERQGMKLIELQVNVCDRT